MRLFFGLFILLFPVHVFAFNMECMNVDEYWDKDSLEFYSSGKQTFAYYFDNDSYTSILCEITKDDGAICEDGSLSVRLYESGEAFVVNGTDEIEFSCL